MPSVLIIDDDPDDRAACYRALKSEENLFRTLEAGDGAGGLAMIDTHHPDCVLLDYAMPQMTGLDVLRRIQAADAFLPVIMLTGQGNEAIAVEAMREGARNYIPKVAVSSALLKQAVPDAIAEAARDRRISDEARQLLQQKLALASAWGLQSAILESAATMIIATDLGGLVTTFTPAAESALGYRAQEIIGQHTPLLWLDDAEIVARAGELAVGHGAKLTGSFDVLSFLPRVAGREIRDWTFIRKDGSRFPARLAVTPLRDGDDAIFGFLGLGDDISEGKQPDFGIQTSEETFSAAAENAPNGMALVDPQGDVLKVNQALCALLGYSEKAMTRKNIRALTHPDDVDIDTDSRRDLFRGRIQSYRVEKRLLHVNGEIVHVLVNTSLMRNSDGSPKYCIAQIQDITERKEIERMKSEFISIVSHELRTPLTSIRGSLGLLTSSIGQTMSETARRLIDIANQNCERLILLVDDILDIDKIALGGMRFEVKREAPGPIMQEAIESARANADTLGVVLRLIPPPAGLAMLVDRERLMQVLDNLLSNAVKFSPPGGEVTLSARRSGSQVRISVEDRGPGIPKDFQHQIFKPFYQANAPSPRKKGGTGLGLHICKQLVRHMRGEIGFDTFIGHGTTLWVEFPAVAQADGAVAADSPVATAEPAAPSGTAAPRSGPPPSQAASAPGPKPAGYGLRVLVCEDDFPVAAMIQAMLTDEGFVADIAYTIAEARQKLATGHYAAMTLDITFPEGDGMDFARELRKDGEMAGLPIIVVTGTDREGWPEFADAVGVIDWIVKPVNSQRLLTSVARATAKAAMGAIAPPNLGSAA